MKVKIEGLKELDAALSEFSRLHARRIGFRVLREAGEPIARAARNNAPRDEWHLHESIDVGTRLTQRQRALHPKPPKSTIEAFVGTANPAGMQQEFGNSRHRMQPWLRPAWDSEKDMALTIIVNQLKVEIDKAAERARRKALKAGGG